MIFRPLDDQRNASDRPHPQVQSNFKKYVRVSSLFFFFMLYFELVEETPIEVIVETHQPYESIQSLAIIAMVHDVTSGQHDKKGNIAVTGHDTDYIFIFSFSDIHIREGRLRQSVWNNLVAISSFYQRSVTSAG